MIDKDVEIRIRRLYFGEHWRIGTIASELGVHHDVVRRVIGSPSFNDWRTARPVRQTLIDPYVSFIADTLEAHPHLRATRLFEMVRSRGYTGGVVQLRRYVRTARPKQKHEAYLRLTTLPGEQAQVDWGCFGTVRVGAAKRSLSCFVLVLAHSRAIVARFALDQSMESFIRGHVHAFETLGGVPRVILYDNLKSAVIDRDGEHIRFHPQLLELAGHYHFAPRPCAPYRANEKGKVERSIRYLRDTFFAARAFSSVDDLNAQLAEWIERVAHARPRPTDAAGTSVAQALAHERTVLLPLPEHAYTAERVASVRVGKQPYIRFDLNDYSVPPLHVGTTLTVLASEKRVRLADAAGVIIAEHVRSYDRLSVIEDKSHIECLAEQKRHAGELRGRDELRSHVANTDAFLEALLAREVPLRGAVRRLHDLLGRYGGQTLQQAIAETLQRGTASDAAVAHICDRLYRARGALPQLAPIALTDARANAVRVKAHDLSPYDKLFAAADTDKDIP